ncbi:hypothetical protein TNCV_3340011 [Trichonephila clavipes]|nr:hypothetical protein TNCV_3340011 [Trichonephila clavipes]
MAKLVPKNLIKRQRPGAYCVPCKTVLGGQTHYCVRASIHHIRSRCVRFLPVFKMKNALKGTYFESVVEVKAKTANLLKMVTPNEQ